MLVQLLVGSLMIAAAVAIHGAMMQVLVVRLRRHAPVTLGRFTRNGDAILMIGAALWILAAVTVEVWVWALLFVALGEIPNLAEALYFALVSFTTLGYGDITLSAGWQLLGPLMAVNGLLIFGWSAAILVGLLTKLMQAKERRE